jgi:hypothetical protein
MAKRKMAEWMRDKLVERAAPLLDLSVRRVSALRI